MQIEKPTTQDDLHSVSGILQHWNQLDLSAAALEILPCCGSKAWAARLAGVRPIVDAQALLRCSDAVWQQLHPAEWEEAFSTHPRIGDRKAPSSATLQSAHWSSQEQGGLDQSSTDIQQRLAAANLAYEQRFGRTFIVYATGKTAAAILDIAECRLANDASTELAEAAEQQRLITQLRLRKWLHLL